MTVYFDPPFWVGVFERLENDMLSACKVTFGAEPKDCEIWDFVLHRYDKLKFGTPVKTAVKQRADNPKRRRRNIKKQTELSGIGTKSQQILAATREKTKTERKQIGKAERELEKQRKFELRSQKRREKHRGH